MEKERKYLPLHQAILDADAEKVKQLIASGADINLIDDKGLGAGYYAVASQRLDMLKLVFSLGAPVCHEDNNGESLLHFAAGEGLLNMVEYLLKEHHLDINKLSNQNRTPLGICMLWTQMEVACCLIENGAKSIGTIYHFEALLKYIAQKIQNIKAEMDEENKECFTKRISILNDFINSNSVKIKKPTNYLKINSDLEKILCKIGIEKGKELNFYKKYLEWSVKQEIINLYSRDKKSPQIRTFIWSCYLQNHITKLCTSVGFYPAYLLPFTTTDMERDWNKPDCEGIDVADFIKNIGTLYPKFGRDYYFPKGAYALCFSLPYHVKDIYKDSDLCVEEKQKNCLSQKYTILANIWNYIEEEQTRLLLQEINYFY